LQSPAEPGFGFFGHAQSLKQAMFACNIAAFFHAVDARADRAQANRMRFNELPTKTLIDGDAAALDRQNLFRCAKFSLPERIFFLPGM
jgi:hypothetical protein